MFCYQCPCTPGALHRPFVFVFFNQHERGETGYYGGCKAPWEEERQKCAEARETVRVRVSYLKLNYIDNNTWARGDMEFLFECSTRYCTSERSERVGYRIEHEKRNSISPSNHVLLCLLYKHKSPQY